MGKYDSKIKIPGTISFIFHCVLLKAFAPVHFHLSYVTNAFAIFILSLCSRSHAFFRQIFTRLIILLLHVHTSHDHRANLTPSQLVFCTTTVLIHLHFIPYSLQVYRAYAFHFISIFASFSLVFSLPPMSRSLRGTSMSILPPLSLEFNENFHIHPRTPRRLPLSTMLMGCRDSHGSWEVYAP